ncbi:hypothetical protein [Aliidiomarina maris]|uniref:Peptidase S74 domain-containing protein n=1 Tax=Aliidiomarina maris TaxID=531312 RepID=A0A327X3Z6_9GAMM|nr:hypothetical protein [Aliidiomarina maris]RAK01605.1 hypothetical protein B0I24_101228 [Aliidiomarina maris]RUO28431.1 hypothetical protein CWE07_01090 [Aliidiomarina maris]
MSMIPWLHENPFIPGTVVRAGGMNAKLDGVASAIESIIKHIEERVPQLPANFTGNAVIAEQNVSNAFLYVSPAGNLTVYRLEDFDQKIAEAKQARDDSQQFRSETEQLRNETAQLRNETSQLKQQTSQIRDDAVSDTSSIRDEAIEARNSARDWADDAAASAIEAEELVATIGTGLKFLGFWDASTGQYPTAPVIGSGLWRVEVEGSVGGKEYKVGDSLIYYSDTQSWLRLQTRVEVVSVNGKTGAVIIYADDITDLGNAAKRDVGKDNGNLAEFGLSGLSGHGYGGIPPLVTSIIDEANSAVTTSFTRVGSNQATVFAHPGLRLNIPYATDRRFQIAFPISTSSGSIQYRYEETNGSGFNSVRTLWDSVNTPKPATLDSDQTYTGTKTYSGAIPIRWGNGSSYSEIIGKRGDTEYVLGTGSGQILVLAVRPTNGSNLGRFDVGQTCRAHGNLIADGMVSGATVRGSDPILKDIQFEKLLSLDEIATLRSVVFKWKYGALKGQTSYGVLADEVDKIAPFLIHRMEALYDEDSQGSKKLLVPAHRTVDYDGLNALMCLSLAQHEYQKWYRKLWRALTKVFI